MEGSGNVFTDEASGGDRRVADVRLGSAREELARWLADLDAQDVLGSALVVVLSDHGQRAPWVSSDEREHVQLAVFTPGEARSAVIATAVSLVDLAPTIRRHLGLPPVASEGAPLPLEGPAEPGRRAVGHVDGATLESIGIRLGGLTAEDVEHALRLNDDGTYAYQQGIRARASSVVRFVERGVGAPEPGRAPEP
jgi:arylsulfatase A-like enzyme